MTNSDEIKNAEAKAAEPSKIPAVGLFGRRCAAPVKISEPAIALFGRKAVEAA